MREIIKIYTENEGFKTGGKYYSQSYNMCDFSPFEIEYEKTRYILDKKERLKKIKEIEKREESEHGQITGLNKENAEKWEDFYACKIDYDNEKDEGLFYNCSLKDSEKRLLEISVYLDGLIDKAPTDNDISKINYLIDEKYKCHRGVLSTSKHDFLYYGEYNNLIFDLLQIEINKIRKNEPINFSPIIPKKPFAWTCKGNVIGTIFGVLFEKGMIKGNKSDFVKQMSALFEGIPSLNYLSDNINLKYSNGNAQFCKETYRLMTDLANTLQQTIKRK